MFRLYVKAGCSNCDAAMQWFKERFNYPNPPIEFWAIGNDPVLNDGCSVWLAKKPDSTLPVLVSFLTNEVIVGLKPEEYQKHVDIFLKRSSPSSFTLAGPESNGAGQAAQPTEEVALAAGVN